MRLTHLTVHYLGGSFFLFIISYHLAVPKSSTNLSLSILTFFEIPVRARETHLTVLKQTVVDFLSFVAYFPNVIPFFPNANYRGKA